MRMRTFLPVAALLAAACARPATPVAPDPTPILPPTGPPRAAAAPATPAASAPVPERAGFPRPVTTAGDPGVVVYPTSKLDAGRTYPVLVFCHGHSMDHAQMLTHTQLARAAAGSGWLAASGLLGSKTHWANDNALALLGQLCQSLVRDHQADPRRIYMVGFSMGGGTALLAAAKGLPGVQLAAVASSQGFTDLNTMLASPYDDYIRNAYGGDPAASLLDAHSPLDLAAGLASMPVYLEHGANDRQVSPDHTRRLATKLQELGLNPTVNLDVGLGHGEMSINTARILRFLNDKVAPEIPVAAPSLVIGVS